MGSKVGVAVATTVGVLDGETEGFGEGGEVGSKVGVAVGATVGVLEGETEG